MKQKESIQNFLIIFAGNLMMFLILFYRSMSLSEILINALIITVVYMILKKIYLF